MYWQNWTMKEGSLHGSVHLYGFLLFWLHRAYLKHRVLNRKNNAYANIDSVNALPKRKSKDKLKINLRGLWWSIHCKHFLKQSSCPTVDYEASPLAWYYEKTMLSIFIGPTHQAQKYSSLPISTVISDTINSLCRPSNLRILILKFKKKVISRGDKTESLKTLRHFMKDN